jgi:hypothetical protein
VSGTFLARLAAGRADHGARVDELPYTAEYVAEHREALLGVGEEGVEEEDQVAVRLLERGEQGRAQPFGPRRASSR